MAYPTASQIAGELLYPNSYWGGSQVSFSFPQTGGQWPGYAAGEEPTDPHFAAVNASQAVNLRAGLAAWDSLIGLTLTETSGDGQIRLAFTDVQVVGKTNTWGYAYGPPSNGGPAAPWQGDIWIEYQKADASFTPGGYDYMAAMHEMGHALGLKHSFEGALVVPTEYDNYRYTIMSYTRNTDVYLAQITRTATGLQSSYAAVYPTTPMVFDIAAIQARYGADVKTNAGDTTYTFDQSKPTFLSLYDAGGNDTIDLASHTRGSIIDLTPGSYSSIDHYTAAEQAAAYKALYPATAASFIDSVFDNTVFTWTDNVGIAFGTVIENVRAGSGADQITGNNADNNISGGAGNDTISGGAGNDYLRGDDGNDSIDGGDGADDINGNRGNDTAHGGAGNDWVVGGQDQDLLYGDDGADIVYGNLGNDTCYGGAGDDWVRGGQGDDLLYGGDGADFMSGDRGDDTLYGGAGADRFNLIAGAGFDRVMDFNSAEGDRVSIEGGLPYTLQFIGGDAHISIGNGDEMILVGVANASQLGTWLYA